LSAKDWFKFLFLGLVWGSSFLWIKLALAEVSPFVLVMFRTGFAFLGLVGVSFLLKTRITRKDLWKYLVLGLFNVAIPFVLISWAETHISSGMAAILNSTVPLFTIILAPLFLVEEKFTLRTLAGLILGFGGVVVLASNELGGSDSLGWLGIMGMLTAAVFYAGSGIFARLMTRGMRPDAQAVGQMGAAFAFILPTTLLVDSPLHLPSLPLTLTALIWLGIMGSCLSTLVWFSLLNSVGPTRTSMTTYMFPLVGVLLGWIFLKEIPDWRLVVGGILVIVAVVIVNTRKTNLNTSPKLSEEKIEGENV
jgi:drug/metabolite transporter (DMT)-like permease